jgi:hypothetical protein
MHRPELDGSKRKHVEYAGNYRIVQGLGSVNPYSYPCCHVRASDLWCRRRNDVNPGLRAPSVYRLPSIEGDVVRWSECVVGEPEVYGKAILDLETPGVWLGVFGVDLEPSELEESKRDDLLG